MKNLLILPLLLLAFSTQAQEPTDFGVSPGSVPQGISVGAQAPDFTLPSQDNKPINLEQLLNNGPVVVMFYRGAWCPVCNRYLAKVVDSLNLISERGARVVAITPNKMEEVTETSKELDNKLILLADTSGVVMDRYQVSFAVTQKYQRKIKMVLFSDIAEDNNQQEARLPVPATFIINEEGQIVWRHFDLNYKNRASVQQILKNLPQQP